MKKKIIVKTRPKPNNVELSTTKPMKRVRPRMAHLTSEQRAIVRERNKQSTANRTKRLNEVAEANGFSNWVTFSTHILHKAQSGQAVTINPIQETKDVEVEPTKTA